MENKLVDKIFGGKSTLSRLETDAAIQGEENSNHSLASKLIDLTPFEAEALAGFSQETLKTSALEALDQKMQNYSASKSTNGFENWFLGMWSLVFVALIALPLITKNEDGPVVLSDQNGASGLLADKNNSVEDDQNLSLESTVVINEERFAVLAPLKSTKTNASVNQPTLSGGNPPNPNVQDVPARMEVKTAELIQIRAKETAIKKPKTKETALANYIFIDFSEIRAKNTIKTEPNLTGARADVVNSDVKPDPLAPISTDLEIPYNTYLEETAYLMQQNKFKEALLRFNVILKHYPTDENGLFYGAYCLFQLKRYQESLDYLEQLKKSPYANFDEEAEWYTFKCYNKLNRYSEGERLAIRIAEQGGFYSDQAREFLKKR
jgi:hypothetical protein